MGPIFVARLRKVVETSFLAKKNRNCHVYIQLVKQYIPLNAQKRFYGPKMILSNNCQVALPVVRLTHKSFSEYFRVYVA